MSDATRRGLFDQTYETVRADSSLKKKKGKKQTDSRFLDKRIASQTMIFLSLPLCLSLFSAAPSLSYPVQTEFDAFDNTGSSVHCRQDYNSTDGGSPLENVPDNGGKWARFRRSGCTECACKSTDLLSPLGSRFCPY